MPDDCPDPELERRRLAADSCVKTHVIAAMGTGLIPSALLDAAAAARSPIPRSVCWMRTVAKWGRTRSGKSMSWERGWPVAISASRN